MTTNDQDGAEGEVYGTRGDGRAVSVSVGTAGGGPQGKEFENYRAAVVIDDPGVQHVFKLSPGAARRRAERVRNHSRDQETADALADRIEAAADEAEAADPEDADA